MWNRSNSGRPLGLLVVELDPLRELRRDRLDVGLDLLVQGLVVDADAPVLLGELLADPPDDERRLLVEQRRPVRAGRERGDLLPLRPEPLHVAGQLVGRGALGCGAHDEAGVLGLDAVEHPAETLALVVGEALRDAVGLRLARHHHHEAAGEADLLGEAGALVRRSGSS